MMVTTLHVNDNGDLELPERPRRRLRLKHRVAHGRADLPQPIPTDLGLSRLIA